MYIHELSDWPKFRWDEAKLGPLLAEARHKQGRLLGRMEGFGFSLREEATLQTLTQDIVKTSEIEGERLDRELVRSSIARHLGLESGHPHPADRNVDGIVEIMLDATRNFGSDLTKDRLFNWHAALFPTGRSSLGPIKVGGWRDASGGAMQIVSGAFGHESVHYEAPSFDRLAVEMSHFIDWFNEAHLDLVLKSGIAHFWFVSIHPFDDGNGRIARALADMMLARSEQSRQRFYSMSSQIQTEYRSYYDVLEANQKATLDITTWLVWYLNCMTRALEASEEVLVTVLEKARFWESHAGEPFNERQRKMINRLLDGFFGKLTSSKWATMAKCSPDTALRDINDLLERQILDRDKAGGRSTSYHLRRLS